MTTHELHKQFKQYFGFNVPIDITSFLSNDPKRIKIDIVKLDKELDNRDPDYDGDKCKYKDQENVSLRDYIKIKYGEEAMKFVEQNI